MHSHKKKAPPERTESSDPSHCRSPSQTPTCGLDPALDPTHRRCTRQATEPCKKGASSQVEGAMGSQKTSLGGNRNIRANSQGAQTAQRTVKGLKLHRGSAAIRQDRAGSISASKKGARLPLPRLLLR